MMLALSLGHTQAYVIKKRGGKEDVGEGERVSGVCEGGSQEQENNHFDH
jgi:hypothetical protein